MGTSDPGPEPDLAELVARHAPRLMALPGVLGVGEGIHDGRPCVVVFVAKDAARVPPLPESIEGRPVVVRRIEPFAAQPGPH